MKQINTDQIHVKFKDGVIPTKPIKPRRYTLTHSDVTGELFLTIGLTYDYGKLNPLRDEVLAEWQYINEGYVLYVYCYVSGKTSRENAAHRYRIFIRELPLALTALRYGDRKLFEAYPALDNVPLWVHFNSVYPEFNRWEYWGIPADYK